MSDENKEQLNQEESEVVDELRRQQLLDNHAVKMEQLKSKFLQEKIIKDQKDEEERIRAQLKQREEEEKDMLNQLEYMKLLREEEEAEKNRLAEEARIRKADDLRAKKEDEAKMEKIMELQREAFLLQATKYLSKPYTFSYYKKKGERDIKPEKKSKKKD